MQCKLPWLDQMVTARAPRRLPVVLTAAEVRALLLALDGNMHLVASLLYGTGMRLLEGLRLRVKDVEFSRREITVRSGKGDKDRVTVLPENLIAPLQLQFEHARGVHHIRTVQELLGNSDVSTTMIYTHVLNKCGRGVLSPFDAL